MLNLSSVIETLDPYCIGYHIDIMDNHFVPNLTWGHHVTNAIANKSIHPIMWVHLMVTNPHSILDRLTLQSLSIISFHLEINVDIYELINTIKLNGWRPSIAIKPKTPIEAILPFLNYIDHVLVMCVEPGFSGQIFLSDSIAKIKALTIYRDQISTYFDISVDGGITNDNIHTLAALGVNDFAVASAIFNATNKPEQSIQILNKLIQS